MMCYRFVDSDNQDVMDCDDVHPAAPQPAVCTLDTTVHSHYQCTIHKSENLTV